MNTYAHPVISAVLVAITCTVIIGNNIVQRRSLNDAFPIYKPQPSLVETRRHAMMIGKWVGESPVEMDGQRRVLLQRNADGSFTVTFKTEWEDERVALEQQVGQWGIAGPVYFTITTGWVDGDRVDPTDLGQPYFYDAYRVVDLDNDRFEFESFSTGQPYVLQRVADSFSIDEL